MLESLLLLAAAAAPVAPQTPAAPSLELLEFLADWPDDQPLPPREAPKVPAQGEKKHDKPPMPR